MDLPTLQQCLKHVKIFIIILLIGSPFARSEYGTTRIDDFDEELYSVIDSVRDGSLWSKSRHVRSLREVEPPGNHTISDNSLWNDLWYECKKRTTFSCIKSGVFKYLDKSLEVNQDVEITDSLLFKRNSNKYQGFCENSDEERDRCFRYNQEKLKSLSSNREDNEVNNSGDSDGSSNSYEDGKENKTEDITEGAENGRSFESLGDVSDILYDKGTQFLMTHDLEFQLPQTFFGGGSIKIEPKSYEIEHKHDEDEGEEDDEEHEGTVVKIIFKPPELPPETRGRFLFHQLKKLFKKKLMHSFMALMLIIKMIKVKLMFLLPMIVGQGTAKRLLLKVLLFLIPGLAHLFKLCHYYHLEHAKYHHHHHKIKHHHHHVQVPVPVPVPVPAHDPLVHHHHHVEPNIHHIHEEPSYAGHNSHDYAPYPSNHISSHVHSDHSNENDYEYPPVGSPHSGGTHNRGEYGSFSQYADNEAAMSSWGLGSNNYQDDGTLDAKDQPYGGYDADVKQYTKSPYDTGGQYQPNDVAGSLSQKQQYYLSKYRIKPQITPQITPQIPVPVSYDPFYSPILQRIDNIFLQLRFSDEPCRERLVCSMYKTPHRFSPHSNLISAELSRDSSDLQKPVNNNADVVRFYRYVQAARDGQDQKDCLRLYPSCNINTET